MTEQEKAIWELVHNWCDKQSAEIPDYNRRVLMDKILHLQERYRAQVELPDIEQIVKKSHDYADKKTFDEHLSEYGKAHWAFQDGAKWMRDHIFKQLKQGI